MPCTSSRRLVQFSALVLFCLFFLIGSISAFVVKPSSTNTRSIWIGQPKQECTFRLKGVAVPAEEDEKKKRSKSDSQEQMESNEWTTTKGGFIPNILRRKTSQKYPKVQLVDDIHDYKDVVVDEKEQIVVVRFFASWCRSCKASKPMFNKLVGTFSDSSVKFVEVPLTKETAYLQEGLGVPSVPYAHIYHPEVGLVEEMKVSKPHFREFSQKLNSYVVGSCDLPDDDQTLDKAIGAFE
mmetsp:Transcript_21916/g.27638  ORF Transcript_21916/g.27638 Transcript_21916/m.27638 type:complete len:238 (-) Transcript_21916:66-779(-)|eukprot:CAMPEP_0203641082 /NCGR_PEP_ID=MMETSP0088-20131115/6394_1 /ASSEMBLY_ACC=CAM_ASM_001087 /TAXON_ID=426623 /ORGANISM="Chaetoceros affinis, Strain CCMP159" /LENGTH=237 /DNA_ID=CAMNT_0050496423 /DNA_START=155 /DNA_END=868 /DNA_ORIENTATION=+